MVYEASSQIAVHCSKPESRSVPWHHIACNEAASRNLNSVYLQRGCFQHPYIQALKEKVPTKQQHGWTWCDVTMRWPWAAFQPVTSWGIGKCIGPYQILKSKEGKQLYILCFAVYQEQGRNPTTNVAFCILAFAKVTVWDSSQGLWSQPMLLRSSVHGRLPGVLWPWRRWPPETHKTQSFCNANWCFFGFRSGHSL